MQQKRTCKLSTPPEALFSAAEQLQLSTDRGQGGIPQLSSQERVPDGWELVPTASLFRLGFLMRMCMDGLLNLVFE